MNYSCLCLPSQSWYSFTHPGGMEGWVGPNFVKTAWFGQCIPDQALYWEVRDFGRPGR